MAGKTINPTRMELTRLKAKQKTALRGHKLLKDKRDGLMKQFMQEVRRTRQLRKRVEEGLAQANAAFTVASAVMSPEMLEPVTAREPKCNGNLLTLTCLEAQIDHVEGTTLAISNEMGVLLCKMREDLDNYDFPPALTRVEKMINGYMFTYGDRESQEEGPCVVYVISETPVLQGNYEEETK